MTTRVRFSISALLSDHLFGVVRTAALTNTGLMAVWQYIDVDTLLYLVFVYRDVHTAARKS